MSSNPMPSHRNVTRAASLLLLVFASALAAETVVRFGEDLDTVDPETVVIERKLESMKVSLDFEEAPLSDVFDFIRKVSGLNIVLDPSVFEANDDEDLQLTLDLEDLTLKNCLSLILDLKGLTRTYKHGVMVIADPDSVKKEMFFKVYDVRDLMFQLQDFPGPDLTLVTDDEGYLGVTLDEPEGSNPFADPDTLQELIETNVNPESWEEENANLNLRNGLLIVTNTKESHLALRKFIEELRSMR